MTRARDLAAFVSNADGDIKFDTDTLFIDSSANRVAIGNTAPSRPLHITANPAMILLEDSDGGSDDKKAQIQVDGGAFEVNARNDDDSSRTDNILVADLGTGSVGIGTNSPSKELHVVGASTPEIRLQNSDNNYALDLKVNATVAEVKASADLAFLPSGSERMRILSGGGLTFNGDTAAVNALDDYEEGTWTPTANVGSVSTLRATYTKIGNLVNVSANLQDITETSSTSDIQIGGLPYTSKSDQQSTGSVMYRYLNVPTNYIQLTALVNPSSSNILFYWSSGSGATWDGLRFADVQGSSPWDMIISVSYRV